ncbi:MAG: GTPase (G3E family) [Oscillospiraceae bacterium]|nr:GTPase (G3E family) [Oscillospiraceae bacterium]
MITIDLLTGILGSGKTTFLREYARHWISKGEHIAILENDFGAVNVDVMMLQDLKCDTCEIAMITGGGDPDCHRRRFKTQLINLQMQGVQRVIMEPSGIFDMDEFFDTLHESPIDRWYQIGSILAVVDAGLEDELTDQMEYLLASEAACAGRLLLSKLDSLGSGETPEQAVQRVLGHINRALGEIRCRRTFTERDVFTGDWASLTDAEFAALSQSGYRNEPYVKRFSADDIRSSVHYFLHVALPEERICAIAQEILNDPECGRIFRIKGSLPSAHGGWYKLNATREKTELAPVADGQPVLIVIGDHLSREAVDRHLTAENTDPDYVSV